MRAVRRRKSLAAQTLKPTVVRGAPMPNMQSRNVTEQAVVIMEVSVLVKPFCARIYGWVTEKALMHQSAADRSISVQPRQTAQARCRRLMARPPILVFSRKFHSYTVSISKTGAFVNNSEKKEQPRRFSAELFSLQVRRCHADACGRTQSGRGCQMKNVRRSEPGCVICTPCKPRKCGRMKMSGR